MKEEPPSGISDTRETSDRECEESKLEDDESDIHGLIEVIRRRSSYSSLLPGQLKIDSHKRRFESFSSVGELDDRRDMDERGEAFVLNTVGLTSAQAAELLHEFGPNTLPEKVVPKWKIYLLLLIEPMPIMIWIAVIIEAGLQNWLDMYVF